MTSPDDPWFRVAGRAELAAFIAEHTRPPDPAHKHLVIEPLIDVDGANATCVSYFAVLMHHDDAPLLRVFGRYHDRLAPARTAAGASASASPRSSRCARACPRCAWGRGDRKLDRGRARVSEVPPDG